MELGIYQINNFNGIRKFIISISQDFIEKQTSSINPTNNIDLKVLIIVKRSVIWNSLDANYPILEKAVSFEPLLSMIQQDYQNLHCI